MLHTLKLQFKHLKLSHAHLLNTDERIPRVFEAPANTMRVHLYGYEYMYTYSNVYMFI
jgi:hypothetical protein